MSNPSRKKRPRRYGLLAISPFFFLVLSYVALSLYERDFSKVPMLVVFLLTSVYALLTTRGLSLQERMRHFSRGAGNGDLLLMVWIFVLAGAFAESAKQMGAISAAVDLTLLCLPENMVLAGIFVAACFVSLSIGTSVGTIAALVPVATGLAAKTGIELPLLVASAVGGAFFGDNLSFISDTTVVATRTQGCRLSDKFRVNFRIVLPAALLTFFLYVALGAGHGGVTAPATVDWVKVVPYVAVLVLALCGVDVLLVLALGILLTGVTGIFTGSFDLGGWLSAATSGVAGMSELILVSMLAGGLLELIRFNGGIVWLIHFLTRCVRTTRGAELCIAALVSVANLCTANNTIAILSVGRFAADISERYGVDRRKSASLLDTFSCCVQGLIPYGAQLLIAGGLAAVSPLEIVPYLYYPMAMFVVALLAVWFRFPRRYSL